MIHVIVLIIVFLAAASLSYAVFEASRRKWSAFLDWSEQKGEAALTAAAGSRSARSLVVLQLALAAAFFLFGFAAINIVLGLLLAPLGFLLPLAGLRRTAEKRRAKITEQMVEALQLMSSGLKSGLNLAQAVDLLVHDFPPPISDEFQRVLAEVRLGVEIDRALSNLAERLKIPVLSILATGVSVTYRCGGDLSEIFDHIAETIRSRAVIEKKVEAVTSLGRSQARVLSFIPFALGIVLYFIDPQHIMMLFEYTFGIAALLGAVILIVIANLWMHRLTKVEV